MQQIKPFQEKAFTASGSYDTEFSGLPVRSVGVRFTATVAGAAATIRTDAAFKMLGTIEINQAELPLIRMRGSSWRLLSAITRGSFDFNLASATQLEANAMIDLQKIMPTAMMNSADKKLFARGIYGALADYSGTAPSGITGTLRAYIESSELDPTRGFLRPRFTESSYPLLSADSNPQVFKFEQDTVVPFIMVQAYDDSAFDRIDGLIKQIRVDRVGQGGVTELARGRWGHFRHYLGYKSNFTAVDYSLSAGCVLIPLINRRNAQYNYAEVMRAGDSLTINYDTIATVEETYTSVTAAAPDVAIATIVGFTQVEGTGDAQSQLRQVGQPTAAAGAAMNAVATNAKQRRMIARAQRYGAQ